MTECEICISSNVTCSHILIQATDINQYLHIADVELFMDCNWETKFNGNALLNLQKIIKEEIEHDINKSATGQISDFIAITEFEYYGRMINLNLRNKDDFSLGILISFEKIINKTIELGGLLHIFNRSVLKEHRNASVLAVLKTSTGLTFNEIQKKFIELSNEFKSFEPVTEDSLVESLTSLMKFGLVDYDSKSVYKLTGKGYILVL